jgi:hypothetical protein
MNIFEFTKSFPDEEACITHFKAQRDLAGIVCPQCGCKHHYWLRNKLSYECKQLVAVTYPTDLRSRIYNRMLCR